jgi:hypothetical protein
MTARRLYRMLTTATASSASISSLVTSCTDVVGRSRHFSIFSANDSPALKTAAHSHAPGILEISARARA